jgi:hypothetical protein
MEAVVSWSLNVPKQETADDFVDAIWEAKESPKADGRTKIGKAQNKHVYHAREALELLAEASGALAGTASGHVSPDLSGNVSVNVSFPG